MCLVVNLPKAIEDVRLNQKQMLTAQELLDVSSSKSDVLINELHLIALATEMVDNNTFQLNQMLKQTDKDEFIKAMDKEMADREGKTRKWLEDLRLFITMQSNRCGRLKESFFLLES